MNEIARAELASSPAGARAMTSWTRLLRDRRGASAVEFALIVPLMLVMYLGTLELGQGIETNKKVGRAASMVGDLVTQEAQVTSSDLDGILGIGKAILQPYNRSEPTLEVVGITVSTASPPVATVLWSRKLTAGNFDRGTAPGTVVVLPGSLNTAGAFVVKVNGGLDYQPLMTWNSTDANKIGYKAWFPNLPMQETYYLRPRMSTVIPCTDC